jgi:hypothetical protein
MIENLRPSMLLILFTMLYIYWKSLGIIDDKILVFQKEKDDIVFKYFFFMVKHSFKRYISNHQRYFTRIDGNNPYRSIEIISFLQIEPSLILFD